MSLLSAQARQVFSVPMNSERKTGSEGADDRKRTFDREPSVSKEKNEKMRELQTVLDYNGICRSRRILRRKLSLSPDVGGNLPEILGYEKTVELIHESDQTIWISAQTRMFTVSIKKKRSVRSAAERSTPT